MIKKIKNSKMAKILILVFVFIVVILIFWLIDFGDKSKTTASIDKSSLPVIAVSYDSFDLNILYGHTQEMDPVYMRDSITPIQEDNSIDLNILECDEKIIGISFEVKSINNGNLVQSTEVNNWEQDGKVANAKLNIENIIEKDTEYILIVNIKTANYENIRYYTRIIQGSKSYFEAQVDFVKNFSDSTFDAEAAEGILSFLEPDSTKVDNSNLGLVNINSNSSRIEWGELAPTKLTEQTITIKEIIGDVACIQLEYIVYTQKTNEYYNITEFYRLRITETRTYLLDFQRQMQQIFDPSTENVGKSNINIGIDSDSQIELKTDFSGNFVTFVNEGALWCMDISLNKITKIFSFSDANDTDPRKTNDQYDIKIISVSENGDIEFLLYGYMNSGEHEGKVGIALYKYINESELVEELLFVPSNRSFDVINQMIGELLYVSDSGSLFLILDNYIYSIDLAGKEYVEIASGISLGNYVISYDHRMIAWHENGSVNSADAITVLDLETGESCPVKAEEGTKIKALGFLENDFVYGIAKDENISQDITVQYNFLMDIVKVIDINKNTQQEETGGGMFFTSATTGYNSVVLKRVKLNASSTGYDVADDLTIFSFGEREAVTTATKVVEEIKKTVLVINFLDKVTTGEQLSKNVIQEVTFDNTNSLSVRKMSSESERYYVYSRGSLSGIYASLASAISKADLETGVVLDDSQNYVWIRGARKSYASVAGFSIVPTPDSSKRLGVCIQELLNLNGINDVDVEKLLENGDTAVQILDSYLDGRGVYLKGITVDQGLYFISKGQPLIGMLNDSDCVVVVGYDSKNVTLLYPETGVVSEVTNLEAEAFFEAAQYRFITLLDN